MSPLGGRSQLSGPRGQLLLHKCQQRSVKRLGHLVVGTAPQHTPFSAACINRGSSDMPGVPQPLHAAPAKLPFLQSCPARKDKERAPSACAQACLGLICRKACLGVHVLDHAPKEAWARASGPRRAAARARWGRPPRCRWRAALRRSAGRARPAPTPPCSHLGVIEQGALLWLQRGQLPP